MAVTDIALAGIDKTVKSLVIRACIHDYVIFHEQKTVESSL